MMQLVPALAEQRLNQKTLLKFVQALKEQRPENNDVWADAAGASWSSNLAHGWELSRLKLEKDLGNVVGVVINLICVP